MNTDSKNSSFPTSSSNPSGSSVTSSTGGGLSSGSSGMSSSTGGLSSGGSGASSGTGGMSSGGSGGYSSGASSSGSSGGSLSGGSNMSGGMNGGDGTVHRVAQAAHQYVDKLEQTLGSGGDRVMSMQQEYGEMASDYVKQKPLQSIGIAFAVGVVFSKLFMR